MNVCMLIYCKSYYKTCLYREENIPSDYMYSASTPTTLI